MMSMASIFFGKTPDERDAFHNLMDKENETFNLQPMEDEDLGTHVRADIPRFQILNARQQFHQATNNRKDDRNFYAIIVIGIILFVKTGISWDSVVHFVSIVSH